MEYSAGRIRAHSSLHSFYSSVHCTFWLQS